MPTITDWLRAPFAAGGGDDGKADKGGWGGEGHLSQLWANTTWSMTSSVTPSPFPFLINAAHPRHPAPEADTPGRAPRPAYQHQALREVSGGEWTRGPYLATPDTGNVRRTAGDLGTRRSACILAASTQTAAGGEAGPTTPVHHSL